MAPPLLTLQDIHLSFGGTPLMEGVDLTVSARDRICLVGRNGSGKSTLMKIASGQVQADSGERFLQPGTTVRYLEQEPSLAGFETVGGYVRSALRPADSDARALVLIEKLGLDAESGVAHLSGGEARRAALARALAPEPNILLLDEPTNHLDLPAILWLEAELARLTSALVLISHDRRFLERLSRATVWIDRGRSRRMDKGFGGFEAWRDEVMAQEELEQHKLDRQIVREEHWLTYGVTARRKRNQRRLAGLHALRAERKAHRRAPGVAQLEATEGVATPGKRVIEAKGISKSYDGRAIVAELDLRVLRGDRIGIVGPNGVGKTTLVNLLTGVTAPDTGEVRLGTNIEMVTLDQRRESLDPEWTLGDALTGGRSDMVMVGDTPRHVIGYMKDFLFQPEQVRTPISRLSGGERGRLMLARALARPSNLLVLDEPTNDLDLETLDLLQELLADYAGTVLLVSHDRDFLDRVVTSTVAPDPGGGAGLWREYAGGYCDMVMQQKGGAGVAGGVAGGDAPKPQPPGNAAAPSPKRTQRKLSFKEQHALDALPGEIAALEEKIVTLEAAISDPQAYARDPDGFGKTAGDLEAARATLSSSEERWLELEEKREALAAE